ncbi:hypothetical protein SPRG_03431 [Saprolegnia parasitica CBS 223.65]|uniref:PH domain-containing protein n=1 Tax=Saprolegnia parasitica (strain CBS 223.65) TaxID=695850 RepID=A0A067CSL2_SAPPC|nr:hypothetical protein SPRG_03431 [Saprolegnia parasitica CBS 223.65]KDO32215.1 hypothetical protein SPRG_03431 [Saprolegnia parasitica CBS 223.65]|eukprot:XP_012197392.1 hypothetical protein SPRG_03431 [Saprolegnia parasitica CBS 223.65]
MVASSSVETVPGSIEMADAAYAYTGHLVLSFDDETAPLHGSAVRVLDCQLAFADDKNFLNERFFLSTPSGQLVTATTKSAADRDAWLLALQLVLDKRATPSPAIVETSLSQRIASADAVLACFRDWHKLLALQANDPLGLFKETRHWSRFGAKDKAAYHDLQAYMDGGDIDVCNLVAGLYTFDGLVAHLDKHYGVRGQTKRQVPYRDVFDAAKTPLEDLPANLWPVRDALEEYCDASTWQRLVRDHSNTKGVRASAIRCARNRNLKNDATVAAVPRETKMPKTETTAVVAKQLLAEMDAHIGQVLAGQAELHRGQVAIARHVTTERVATAKAIEAVRKHEAELPAIFLSHCILTREMLDLPIARLEPIPDEYDGDVYLYIRDTVSDKVVVGDPYPLRVPRGGVMACLFPAAVVGAALASLSMLAPQAPGMVRSAKLLTDKVVSRILPAPSAQDARKGLRIDEISQLGDPQRTHGGSKTIVNQDGDKVLRGTAESIAACEREMAATATNRLT